jgi:BNR repeat-containing family member
MPAWYNSAWPKRKKITIPAAKVASNQANFPVYINVAADAQISAAMRADGKDLVFTLADGVTKVDHEIIGSNAVADNGMWTWYNDPRAIRYNNKTYIGYINANGAIYVTSYNHTDGSTVTSCLRTFLETDDHDNPALVILPDGRILAFYTKHPGSMYYRVSTNPEDISSWQTEVDFSSINVASQSVGSGWGDGSDHFHSYANVQVMGDGTVYVWWRGTNWRQCVSRCAYTGLGSIANWTAAKEVFYGQHNPGTARPYGKYVGDGNDTIYICLTDAHPDSDTANGIYLCKYTHSTGLFKDLAGNTIGDWATITVPSPISTAVMTAVWTPATDGVTYYGTANARAWNWSLQIDGSGNPVVAFAVFNGCTGTGAPPPEGTVANFSDHRYWWGRWNGSAIVKYPVTYGGGALFTQATTGTSQPSQPFYSGGICIDPEDVFTCYSCSNYDFDLDNGTLLGNRNWRVYKHVSTDNGATWNRTLIQRDGLNARPYVPPGRVAGTPCAVLWWDAGTRNGYYTDFLTYVADICTDSQVTATKEAWVEAPSLSSATDSEGYVYYGNADAADQSNISGVWPTSDYHMVNHMIPRALGDLTMHGAVGLRHRKASSTAARGTTGPTGSFTSAFAGGKLIGGQQSYGNSNAWSVTDVPSLAGSTGFTIEAWIKGSDGYIASNWTSGGAAAETMFRLVAGAVSFFVRTTAAQVGGVFTLTGKTFNGSNEHHMVAIFDPTLGRLRVFCDGTESTTLTYTTTDAMHGTPRTAWRVGDSPHSTPVTNNIVLGRIRILATAKDANWVTTEYRNTGYDSFYTVGSEELMPVASTSRRRFLGRFLL